MIDFIHIGEGKTGTTWLQKYGFHHPEISYLGRPFDDELSSILKRMVHTPDFMFNPVQFQSELQKYLEKKPKERKISGISWEWLISSGNLWKGDHIFRNAERLRAVFGDIKVIYVIREQKSMLLSLYSQYIKMGGTLKLEEFLFDPYHSIDCIEKLKYHYTIDKYIHLFGKENVWIGLYEEFKLDKPSFLKKLYSFIGCKNTEYLPQGMDEIANSSLKDITLSIFRFLNHFIRSNNNTSSYLIPIDKLILAIIKNTQKYSSLERESHNTCIPYYNFAKDNYIRKHINNLLLGYLRETMNKINIGKPIKFNKKIEKFLNHEYKQSNELLYEKYDLNIKKFGWVL